MFEILKQVPEGDAIDAAYETTLELYQRERLATRKLRGLPLTKNPLAAQLLDEIGEAEGKHVADLPKETTDRYIVEVSQTLQRRLREAHPDDSGRGEAILEEMRAQYSWPHYGRRAS